MAAVPPFAAESASVAAAPGAAASVPAATAGEPRTIYLKDPP